MPETPAPPLTTNAPGNGSSWNNGSGQAASISAFTSTSGWLASTQSVLNAGGGTASTAGSGYQFGNISGAGGGKSGASGHANAVVTSRALRLPPSERQARARNAILGPLIRLGLVKATPIMTLAETEAALFANQLLPANWLLSDAQLSLRPLTNSPALELRTDRIFLDPPAVRAALSVDTNAQPVLTYLATLLRAGTNATAYPMVTAVGAPLVPADLRDDEIVVNQWLADDLQLAVGDKVELRVTAGQMSGAAQSGLASGAITENTTTITSNYTQSTGRNAVSVGPISIAGGISYTIPSGQRWVIL